MNYRILAINPGSTSTKISIYDNDKKLFVENVEHKTEDLAKFDSILDQIEFRAETVRAALTKHDIELSGLSGIACRGGLLPDVEGGGYLVTKLMTDTYKSEKTQQHASNLASLIGSEIAGPLGINAYIYDAVTANEIPEMALITGIPELPRQSQCHVLNSKAMARQVAKKYGKAYEDLRLIVVHLGGGVSISAHEGGRIIDSIGDDNGPYFAPERSGGLSLILMIDMCFSGKYTKKEIQGKVRGKGGLAGHFGTADCRVVEKMIEDGDERAKMVYEAMAYHIAKGIGQLTPVLRGKVDYVVLTGGLANSKMLTGKIAERVDWIAPVEIAPGEDEMEALSIGILRILKGEEKAKEYKGPKKEG